MKLFFFSSTETDILMEHRLEFEGETLLEIFEEHEKPNAVPDPVSVADIFARAVGVVRRRVNKIRKAIASHFFSYMS